MILEIIFAILLFSLSTMILIKTRNKNNQFLKDEANRCLGNRCEVKNLNFEGRLYSVGTALLRNKKTGEYKFINQAKLSGIGLIG